MAARRFARTSDAEPAATKPHIRLSALRPAEEEQPEQPTSQPPEEHEEAVNLTERVREILRAHPSGMTTTDLWHALQGEMTNRAYLYSITKRLRDRDQIRKTRGGKFVLKTMPVEVRQENESAVVH